jgi:hypothetical protein
MTIKLTFHPLPHESFDPRASELSELSGNLT